MSAGGESETRSGSELPAAGKATDVFPIYQLAVEMADRISQRRQAANNFGLALNSALISAGGSIWDLTHGHVVWWLLLLAGAGVWESIMWGLMIRSYRQLNSAKYAVIHELEQNLPAAPYAREWEKLASGKERSQYWPISHVESLAPWGFVAIYVISSLAIVMRTFK